MAYEDLTPQERQVLQQSLLAPPPATFAAPGQFNIDPKLRMEAQLGLLGPEGRFIEQLARQQDEERRKEQENAMAQRILSVLGTPDAMNVMRKEAEQNPHIFNSGTVQQAMQFGQMAKQEQERADEEAARARGKEMASMFLNAPNKGLSSLLAKAAEQDFQAYATPEAQSAVRLKQQQAQEQFAKRGQKKERKAERQLGELQSQLDKASPEELDAFEAANPQLLPKVRPIVEARRKEYSDIENLVQDIPQYLVEGDKRPVRLPEAQKIASRFEKQLSPSMQKIKGLSNRLRANQLAQQISEIRSAAPPSEGNKRVLPAQDEIDLSAELAELLGYKDTFTQVPDATLKLLKEDSEVLFGADAYERVVSPAVREQINRAMGKP